MHHFLGRSFMGTHYPAIHTPFATEVRESRREFVDSLGGLPRGIRIVSRDRISKRIQRASGRPLLGEYVPWLVADMLGVSDKMTIRKISKAWLHIYYAILILDDLIDGHESIDNHSDLITSFLLQQRGLGGLSELAGGHSWVQDEIDSAFDETAAAAINELSRHRSQITPFRATEIGLVGKKIAVLRACAAVVIRHARGGNSKEAKIWRPVLDSLATVVQLLDDMTDWKEDLAGGSMTYLLTHGYHGRQVLLQHKRRQDRKDDDAALLVLVETGALDRTLIATIGALRRTSEYVDVAQKRFDGGYKAREYFAALLRSCIKVRGTIACVREHLLEDGIAIDALEKLTPEQLRRMKRALTAVRRSLYILANGS